MIRRPPRSTQSRSSAASDVYKRQIPLWYIRQQSDSLFAPIGAEQPNTDKKEQLYQKYRITPREREVIEQLCLGKTNQQIADTLFISLQTVKDHTHRIYNKVGINSRMKLVQMVNNSVSYTHLTLPTIYSV